MSNGRSHRRRRGRRRADLMVVWSGEATRSDQDAAWKLLARGLDPDGPGARELAAEMGVTTGEVVASIEELWRLRAIGLVVTGDGRVVAFEPRKEPSR
jgi:hypothetical protein